jgi:hypothetical protein
VKILLFGIAKSGTTALFYKIKNSLPPDTICLLEPRSFDAATVDAAKAMRPRLARWFGRREPGVLAKIIPFQKWVPVDFSSFSSFEKQVMIVRDPRDRLISYLLFSRVWRSSLCQLEGELSTFLELLRRKEATPRSVTVRHIIAALDQLKVSGDSAGPAGYQHTFISEPLDFHAEHGGVFLYRYEDMIDGKFAALEDYLGLKLGEPVIAEPALNRVARTRGYGGWRDWFTPEDVDFFRPVMQPFLDRYYPDADWELNAQPSIRPEHASAFVERTVNGKRAAEGLPALNLLQPQ